MLEESPKGNNVENWNSEDVSIWISEIDPSFVELGYCKIFINEDINGSALLELDEYDLKELGISKMGHRKNIMKNIKNIKNELK